MSVHIDRNENGEAELTVLGNGFNFYVNPTEVPVGDSVKWTVTLIIGADDMPYVEIKTYGPTRRLAIRNFRRRMNGVRKTLSGLPHLRG